MSFPSVTFRKTITASTMDDASAAIRKGYGHGTVCLAEKQLSGRGRLPGRQWENGDLALLFSVILEKESFCTLYPPTQVLALALCQHLEGAYGLNPQIKWPNDVLLSGCKIAGILVETEGNFIIAGMGLNIVLGTPGKEFRSPVAGLADSIGQIVEPENELRSILDKLFHLIRQPAHIRELRKRLAYMNRNVQVRLGDPSKNQVCHGRITGLNEDGALQLKTEEDEIHLVYSGEFDFS